MDYAIKKRSISLNGRKTSITLEDEFWLALNEVARRRGISVRDLLAEVNANRRSSNLSSAVRVYLLRQLKSPLGTPLH